MRKLALTLTVALIVGGCSSESEVAQNIAQTGANSKNITAPAQAPRPPTDRKSSFAAMPDHGTLLAYDPTQQPRHRGAQIYHAVQLSEAHALNAAAPGKSIELPMPSGGTVRINYERHEEGLDGNWSWVGKTSDGLDAVITFGESAVFGRIAQRDTEAVRLTMSAGRSWLVESDPSKMLDGNLGRDSDESDVLIPHSVVAAASAKKRSAAAMAAAGDEAAGPAQTVDVVLGFTNGLVTKYGSAANANTRLANLVAITNQGYVNSLVNPRIRLVRTVQVAYTDTNSNETALEAVTGYTCTTTGCTTQTVPTELVPLRTARDTYGGDLVSLVRPFQAPQHQGCGIAWLLGGGGFTIDNTDAPFGYSVISDGTDVDEGDGRTYFCREETLSHELGHNMGQQHNIEDAGTPPDTGTHSYSYGYREATSTGFYTVMAYRLPNSSQFSINYFGNPSVNYADTGRPTGSATADNTRSLNIAMPLVVQFRNTVVPIASGARTDFNGDGRSDIVWRNQAQALMSYWWQNGPTRIGSGSVSVVSTSQIVGTGDFDGDGRADQLWNSSTNNHLWIYRSRGDGGFDYQFVDFYPAGWSVVGVTDLNGDGKADIVLRNDGLALLSYWRMNGPTRVASSTTSIAAGNRVVASGDFDGDGLGDLLWSNDASRLLWLFRSRTDGGFDYLPVDYYPTGWSVSGATDLNGDGKADIVWRNASTSQMSYWWMNGATRTSSGVATIPATSSIVGTGDFDGDGLGDLLWSSSDGNFLWIYRSLGNGGFTYQFVDFYPSGWQVANSGS
jgi:peptidyl-Asp metalloendopeptidase